MMNKGHSLGQTIFYTILIGKFEIGGWLNAMMSVSTIKIAINKFD